MVGFDAKDKKILAIVRSRPANISHIAERSSISRRTVAYRVARLARARILCGRVGRGSERIWELSSVSQRTKTSVQIYRGDDVIRAHALLKQIPRNSTLFGFEGRDFLKQIIKGVPSSFLTEVQQSFRRKKIIIRSVVHRKNHEYIARMADTALMGIYRKRAIASVQVRHESFLGAGAYYVTSAFVLIANEEKRYCVVITDQTIVSMMYACAQMLHEAMEHLDSVERADTNRIIELNHFEQSETAHTRSGKA